MPSLPRCLMSAQGIAQQAHQVMEYLHAASPLVPCTFPLSPQTALAPNLSRSFQPVVPLLLPSTRVRAQHCGWMLDMQPSLCCPAVASAVWHDWSRASERTLEPMLLLCWPGERRACALSHDEGTVRKTSQPAAIKRHTRAKRWERLVPLVAELRSKEKVLCSLSVEHCKNLFAASQRSSTS
eukprot:3454526-Rhodomonas_salina.2